MVCKKCEKDGVLEVVKDVTEKKCKICKKNFRSRIIVVCGNCQSKRGNICLTCGREDKSEKQVT